MLNRSIYGVLIVIPLLMAGIAVALIAFGVLSAMPEEAMRERFDGYTTFLRKPFLSEALIGLVAHILSSEPRRG